MRQSSTNQNIIYTREIADKDYAQSDVHYHDRLRKRTRVLGAESRIIQTSSSVDKELEKHGTTSRSDRCMRQFLFDTDKLGY